MPSSRGPSSSTRQQRCKLGGGYCHSRTCGEERSAEQKVVSYVEWGGMCEERNDKRSDELNAYLAVIKMPFQTGSNPSILCRGRGR